MGSCNKQKLAESHPHESHSAAGWAEIREEVAANGEKIQLQLQLISEEKHFRSFCADNPVACDTTQSPLQALSLFFSLSVSVSVHSNLIPLKYYN